MVSFMETFQQLSKHPKMQELLQASKSPMQTQRASSQSLQSPRQSRSGHMQRKETSKESTHGLVNGQDSNEHTMRQTIPLPMSNAGCFGGGSVFQAMIRPSPTLHGFMPDNAYGAVPPSESNPMYGKIGVQPGFQCAAGSYGMPGTNMGMAGFAQPDAQNQNMAGRPGMNFGSGMPLLNAPAYDNLTPKGKLKDYKEGGQAVKCDTFHGTHDRGGLKARIKELEELNHRLLAELRGKQVEGASGSAGAGGSGGAGEDVVGGAGTGGEGIGGKGTKRRRERDEEDAGESALKQVFKKAKLNEFNGEKKTGEDLEAWIEELEDFFALREFSEEAKAKVAIVQLRSVAKLWWKSYMQTRSRVGPVLWEEFREQAEKRYCSPHYNMEKKMEFYNFKQREEDKHSLSVDEYKEKFLRLHKYAPEVTGNALKSKFIEGLREELKYQVKGSGCTDFLDVVAKAENFEKMEEFTMKKAASARNRVIATGHRPQGSTVPSSRFNSNQTWVNYGQRNNNNNNQRIANNNQRPNTQVNGGQNDNQKKRQPV
ncbi:hypothetical protein L7F22_022669 [Adiantum nelumboides]|nr:hypothetical protein [Adiantum nelumboides]